MSLLVVGLSHHTAPVPVLERVSIPADAMMKVLDELHRSESISEVMALSTCNRIEVYADVARFHPGVVDISAVLARLSGMGVNELGEHLYVHFAEAAADHLLRVASGLDSMVVGESQILGQLRTAYSETGIDRAGASVVSVALNHAVEAFATADGCVFDDEPAQHAAEILSGKRIVIVGAGSMGALAGATLQRLVGGGDLDVVVLNRSMERAERLAGILGGRAAPLGAVAAEIAEADILISSTGATGLVVEATDVAPRDGRPLVVLDLALPRDVDPAVAFMPDLHYIDLEVLRSSGAMVSDAEIEAATTIVAAELRAYLEHQQALAVAPTVTALRARAAQVVDGELLRLDHRLPGLDPEVRAELASAVRRAVDKVLHAPTVRVKELAATPEGNAYAAALRELFGLDPAGLDAVSAVRKPILDLGDDSLSATGGER
jgi:glutamyl-tRNA reductase